MSLQPEEPSKKKKLFIDGSTLQWASQIPIWTTSGHGTDMRNGSTGRGWQPQMASPAW